MRLEAALQRDGLDEAYLRFSDQEIVTRMLALEEYRGARTIFCYVSTGREPDTRALIELALKAGKRVGVPLCTGKGLMEVREITGWDALRDGKYGIPEPKPECGLLPPAEIDLAIVPCVICSHDGLRLGHGGGYYDRYLARLRCPAVCFCREALVREEIPWEPHDRPVTMLITEKGVFCGKGRAAL